MNRMSFTLLASLLLLVVAGSAWAGPGHGFKGRQGTPPCLAGSQQSGPGIFAQIPPEQHAAVQGLLETHQQKAFVLRQDLISKRATLRGLIADPDSTQDAIDAAVEAVNDARGKLLSERTAFQRKLQQDTGLPAFGQRAGKGSFHGQRGFGPGACWR